MRTLVLATFVSEIGTFFLFLVSVAGGGAYPINASIQAMVIVAIPLVLAKAKLIKLPYIFVLWLFILNFLHLIGVRFGLYDNLWWWDIVTHLVTVSLISIFVSMMLMAASRRNANLPSSFLFYGLFILMAVTTLGVLWEMLEFAFDNLFSMNMQYSLGDTVKDLTVDILAGTFVAMVAPIYFRKRSRQQTVDELEIGGAVMNAIGNIMDG